MKKAILLTCITIFSLFAAKGQDTSRRFSVEISAGPAFPIGSFASQHTSSGGAFDSGKQPGSAKIGVEGQISASYHFTRSFGLMLLAGAQLNKQDPASLNGSIMSFYASDKYVRVVGKTGSWKIGKIMPGCFLLLPVSGSNKLFFEGKVLIGFCKTSVPKYSYTVYNDSLSAVLGNPYAITAGTLGKTKLPITFCYQLSGELKYYLNERLALTAAVDYFAAQPVYKYTAYTDPLNPATSEHVKVRKTYPLNSVNMSIGVGWAF